jgi:hypothetical protein
VSNETALFEELTVNKLIIARMAIYFLGDPDLH